MFALFTVRPVLHRMSLVFSSHVLVTGPIHGTPHHPKHTVHVS